MPCYSTIKRTKLTDGDKLARALSSTGHAVQRDGDTITATKDGRRMSWTKSGGVYSVDGYTQELGTVSKKYAEISVREWARRRGFAVTENDGTNMTLINRRNS